MPGGLPERRKDPPYFFFSYHRSAYRPTDNADPDVWFKRLFNALCIDVAHVTGTSNPGFMDTEMPLARNWPKALAEALACCRVFVPVLGPGYFTSEFCGKEWTAFTERARMHAGPDNLHAAMVPLLWTKFRLEELPPQVATLNLIPPGFPPLYREGFFALMKVNRFRTAYRESVLRMAEAIKETAEQTKLAPCAPMDLDATPNVFTEHQAAEATHQVRIIVAAHHPAPGRSAYFYGRTMLEWTPFRGSAYRGAADSEPIVRHAASVIAELGHHAMIETVDAVEPTAGQPPAILLLDPWAAGVPEIRAKLRAIDIDPVHVVVPWNDEDEETVRETSRLRDDLRAAMPNSLSLNGSAPRVPTLETFRALLPKAVNEAIATHFRTAPAYPPEEPPSMDKPIIEGPEA